MRYRTKLLLLLFFTAMVPSVLLPLWSRLVNDRTGAFILTRIEDGVTELGRRNLSLAVSELTGTLSQGARLVRMAALRQAAAVSAVLVAGCTPPDLAERVSGQAPADLAPERYSRPGPGGAREPLAVDYSRAGLFSGPDGAEPPRALAGLAGLWRPMLESGWDMVQWFFVVTPAGGVALYPAPASLPPGFDPCGEQWYGRAAKAAAGWDGRGDPPLVWTVHQQDPLTGRSVAIVAMPLLGADGKLAAVTGMALPLAPLLAREPIIRQLPTASLVFLVAPERDEAGRRGLFVVESVAAAGGDEALARQAVAERQLRSADAAGIEAVSATLEADGHGLSELDFAGRPCLWAYQGEGQEKAGFVIITPMASLAAPVTEARSFLGGVQDRQQQLMGGAWAAIVLGVAGLALYFARRSTRRLSALSAGMRSLARGDFDVRVADLGRDEFGDMGRTFNEMVPELKRSTRTRQELAVAREVQEGLLPGAAPAVPGLDAAGICQFSAETGGDYYDYLADGATLTVVVGDVSGHGLSSALLMTAFRAFFRLRADLPADLSELATDVNRHVALDTMASGRFVTAFLARFEPASGRVLFVRAGHDPALVYDPARDAFSELAGQGLPMGVDAGTVYRAESAALNPGQVVAIGTDGIWESVGAGGEMYGRERFAAAVRASAGLNAAGICRAVAADLAAFRGEAPQTDDVTLVVVKAL